MSCGEPHETDCSEVLDHLYEYLDREMSDVERHKFEEHFGECNPCLEKYGLEQAVKKLVKRCCGHDDVPGDLRAKVLTRIELIRSGQIPPVPEPSAESPAQSAAQGVSQAAAKSPKSTARASASEAGPAAAT